MQPKEKLNLKTSCGAQTRNVRAQRAHEYKVIYSVLLAAQVGDEVSPKATECTLGSDLRPGRDPGLPIPNTEFFQPHPPRLHTSGFFCFFSFRSFSFLFKGSLAATAPRQKMYSFKWLRLEIEAWIMMLPFIIALINHTTFCSLE